MDVTEEELTPQGRARFVIRVSDTGIGMEEEFVGRIFDSFSRERDSRVNRIEGSGLGMAITKTDCGSDGEPSRWKYAGRRKHLYRETGFRGG